MTQKLQKGGTIKLPSDSDIVIGLGWNSVQQGKTNVDCDASAILCGLDKKAFKVIYFGEKRSENGAVIYGEDSRTGGGNGESEQIFVNFRIMPANVGKIVIAANIYDAKAKRQHFGMINNAFVCGRHPNETDEIFRFDLTDDYSGMSGIIAAEITRCNGYWEFLSVGRGVPEASRLISIIKMYQ